ncbi:hypothetical protein Syun_012833 [Stephania yunnanensis]|uniref:Uncharacterized protein n=1 Tax=Stephania yunnanensis TaxID=152371 RepID=A0AAP0K1J6_9MAGN
MRRAERQEAARRGSQRRSKEQPDERRDTGEGRGRTASAMATSQHQWHCSDRADAAGPEAMADWRRDERGDGDAEVAWGSAAVDWSAREQHQRLRRRLRGERSRRGDERGAGSDGNEERERREIWQENWFARVGYVMDEVKIFRVLV